MIIKVLLIHCQLQLIEKRYDCYVLYSPIQSYTGLDVHQIKYKPEIFTKSSLVISWLKLSKTSWCF